MNNSMQTRKIPFIKRIFCFFLIGCLLCSTFPIPANAAEASDGIQISSSHQYLSDVNILIGNTEENYPGFEFQPSQTNYSDLKYQLGVTLNMSLTLAEPHSSEPLYAQVIYSDGSTYQEHNPVVINNTASIALDDDFFQSLSCSGTHTIFLVVGPTPYDGTTGVSATDDVYAFEFSIFPGLYSSTTFKFVDGTLISFDSPTDSFNLDTVFLADLKNEPCIYKLETTETKVTIIPRINSIETKKVYFKIGNDSGEWEESKNFKPKTIDLEPGITPVQMRVAAGEGENERIFYFEFTRAGYVQIVTQPQGFECDKGVPQELSVVAASSDPSSEITYQWQRTARSDLNGFSDIPGATESTFTPPTNEAATWYYRCNVSVSVDGKPYSVMSDAVTCTVRLNTVNKPEVIRPLGSFVPKSESAYKTEYRVGQPFDKMYIGLPYTETGATYIYEVLYSKTDSIDDAIPYETATVSRDIYGGDTFEGKPYIACFIEDSGQLPVGEHYIFLRVTAVDKTDETNRSESVVSSIKLTYLPNEFTWTKGGTGTESEPYIITEASDLEYIRMVVNEWDDRLTGKCFRFGADVTLPENWMPIGGNQALGLDGLRVFSGQIDGASHTLTIPKGGKPLFNLVSATVIKNLKIYGEEIDGCGLIDSYFLDYGLDGRYETGCPETATLENVHLLKGSSTRLSGLMRGSGSGANTITLRNCTVDPGVVIGYTGTESGIGSFVGGAFNGQMEGCYSAATVKGRDRVGGLAGGKGQSMGLCSFINCGFTGTIEATGEWVGGIIGGGYVSESAPNTMVVSFNNCFVKADITAKDYVGGIFGGEGGVIDAWNKCVLSNSTFYGTINCPGQNVGGIIGYYNGVNTFQEMENNYFYEETGRELGVIGKVGNYSIQTGKGGFASQAAADEWYANTGKAIAQGNYNAADVVQKLNSGSTSLKNWVVGTDGFPAHSTNPIPIRLQINGEWPKQQLGQALDTTGITYTTIWSDGSTRSISPEDVTLAGYDKDTHGSQVLTAIYGTLRTEFNVIVLKPEGTIKVAFALKGDTNHGPSGEQHTLAGNNLTDWIVMPEVEVSVNATVLDVIEKVLREQTDHTYEITNETGNYISAIKRDGVELKEFTNGAKSGWMYALNGKYSDLGVSEQYLNENDSIVFYYTDDYTLEKTDTPAKPGGDDPGVTVTDYGPYLTGVLSYLKANVTSPVVSSTKGEWAVLAQARGGVLSSDAKKAYLTNLWHHGDELGGVLDESGYKHTEYSRVILALTSIGVDASAVKYGGKTYDFVYRLLEKDCAQVMEQGNNGTAFALIALDSGNYLSNTSGNKARATWIDALVKGQKADGSWSIDPSDSKSDLDTTAMAIQALAPYYLSETKYGALGAKTSHNELRETVDDALSYLKSQQDSTTGGFGTPEADVQVIVALSALKQDAGEYKKGESRSVLSDLLSYAVGKPGTGTSISFSKTRNGQTNQMSTEQAAYALVAYDRFMNKKNGLYDMATDATLSQGSLELGVIKHTITANAGTGGSISPGTATAETGGSQTFTITPDTGYQIKDVKVDGVSVGAKSSYTLTVTKCHIVSAEFENMAGYHTITVTSGAGGAISPTTVTVETGANQTFTITPFTGYRIVDVAIDGYSYGAKTSHTFTNIKSDHTISAVFASANDITVYFTLKGDFVHSSSSATHTLSKGGLQTWIPRQAVTVTKGATVYDVFTKVLNQYGYRYIGAEQNYVETIITPSGTRLSEFTNGRNSGWMYTVNGIHPEQGLRDWTVYDGNEIIWHYTDDYTQERGGTGSSSTNDGATQLSPTVSGTNAVVSIGSLSDAITSAINTNSGTILVAPQGSTGASTLTVDLPTGTLYTAANNGIGVTIQSGAGTITIPSSTLTGIANTANGSQVSVTATTRSGQQGVNLLSGRSDVTVAQLSNSSVTEVTITSGSQNITSWGGRSITISLPVNGTYFSAGNRYTVYQVSANGSVETLSGYCSRQNGSLHIEVSTTHLSTFVAVPNQASTSTTYLPFRDVSTTDWFYNEVSYVYEKGLFNGESPTIFAPDGKMNRAMLVTVLHRYEGTPAPVRANSFSDVPSGQWFTDGVAWANYTGVVNGKGNGRFAPYDNITREEIAVILYRYAKIKGWDVTASASLSAFYDANKVSDWATRAVQWANAKGILNGKGGGMLDPGGNATRAEVAAMLMRFTQAY